MTPNLLDGSVDEGFFSGTKEHLAVMRRSLNGAEALNPSIEWLDNQSFCEIEGKNLFSEYSFKNELPGYKARLSLNMELTDSGKVIEKAMKKESEYMQDNNLRVNELLSKSRDCLSKSKDILLHIDDSHKKAGKVFVSPMKMKVLPLESKLDYYYLSENPYSKEYGNRGKKSDSSKQTADPCKKSYHKLNSWSKNVSLQIDTKQSYNSQRSSPRKNEHLPLTERAAKKKVPFDLVENSLADLPRQKTLYTPLLRTSGNLSIPQVNSTNNIEIIKKSKKKLNNLKDDMTALKRHTCENIKIFHDSLSNYKQLVLLKHKYLEEKLKKVSNSFKDAEIQTKIHITKDSSTQTINKLFKEDETQTMINVVDHKSIQVGKRKEWRDAEIQTIAVNLKSILVETEKKMLKNMELQTEANALQSKQIQTEKLIFKDYTMQTEVYCSLYNTITMSVLCSKNFKDACLQTQEQKLQVNITNISIVKRSVVEVQTEECALKNVEIQTKTISFGNKMAQTIAHPIRNKETQSRRVSIGECD